MLNDFIIKPEPDDISIDAMEAYESAMKGIHGAKYSLIAYLGYKDIGDGNIEYAFIAEQSIIYKIAIKSILLITVDEKTNKDGSKTYSVSEMIRFMSGRDDVLGSIMINPKTDNNIPGDAMEIFNRHFSFFLGAKNTAIALLATQVVNGTAYYFLTQSDIVPKKFNGFDKSNTTGNRTAIQIMKLYSNFPDVESKTVLTGYTSPEIIEDEITEAELKPYYTFLSNINGVLLRDSSWLLDSDFIK